MEGKDISGSQEQSQPTQPPAQSIETNGEVVLLIKDETAQAISKTTAKKTALQRNVAKKRSALQLLRVALFMFRHGSGQKSKSVHVEVASKGLWRRLLGSIRLLHLHDNQPQPALAPATAPEPPPVIKIENFHELQMPSSPTSSPSSLASSSSIDNLSQYASAQNLQELGRKAGCNCDDDIEEIDEIIDDGDEMIDTKADEFIANFYEQMRLQRIKYDNQMSKRG